MSGLENSLFQLKFTAKSLNRQAQKAGKEETSEKNKVKKALQQGHDDIAKVYAQNAIRKANERVNLLKLASRIDAVASRVQTAVTMRQVSGSMSQVVRGMDKALQSMNLQQISLVMDKFETQFEDMDAAVGYYEEASGNTQVLQVDEDKVEELLGKVADENGLEMRQELNMPSTVEPVKEEEKEDLLAERLRALRG